MRKKIEELRNKEEGFTLVELLAVIVILGIIVAIAIPAIGSVIDRASSGATDAEEALVEDAARLYVTNNQKDLASEFGTPGEDGTSTIEVGTETLINQGYLEKRADEDVDEDVKGSVVVTKNDSGTYKYEFKTDGTPGKDPLE